jgi:hypothetical protein
VVPAAISLAFGSICARHDATTACWIGAAVGVLRGKARRLGLHRVHALLRRQQARAALRLRHGAEPQPVLLRPAPRQRHQAPHVAALELQLQLAHGRLALLGRAGVRDDLADVQRHLDHGAARPRDTHVAREPHDVGRLPLDQRGNAIVTLVQQLREPLPHGRAVVALRIDLRRRAFGAQVDVVLQPVQRVVAGGLHGLHPARAFLAQPQHHTVGGKALVGGVEIAGLQAGALDSAALQGGFDGLQAAGRNAELELDFHSPMMPAPSAPRRQNPASKIHVDAVHFLCYLLWTAYTTRWQTTSFTFIDTGPTPWPPSRSS